LAAMIYEAISLLYAMEGCTFLLSIALILYARRKLRLMPYDEDRLRSKYQVKEVLLVSMAILPSIIVSVATRTLSLVPTLLWVHGVINYHVCCLAYFMVHSLNCILTKLTLIGCHKGMRQRFQLLFVTKLRTPRKKERDAEKESDEYFEQVNLAWFVERKDGRNERYKTTYS
ncbi:hypothetical protein PMAYCL1PPCAC_28019, partial [Pristionchus mayeri]